MRADDLRNRRSVVAREPSIAPCSGHALLGESWAPVFMQGLAWTIKSRETPITLQFGVTMPHSVTPTSRVSRYQRLENRSSIDADWVLHAATDLKSQCWSSEHPWRRCHKCSWWAVVLTSQLGEFALFNVGHSPLLAKCSQFCSCSEPPRTPERHNLLQVR
jgi:hypothetical protein